MNRFWYGAAAVTTAVAAVVSYMPMTAVASTSLEQRKKALVSANVIDNYDVTLNDVSFTRAQFAKMLVKASSYSNNVAQESNVSVYKDVLKDSEYAGYIRIAAEKGWMTAYLGGLFKPDQGVKLAEAEKACLTLLGYTNDDFAGNLAANRNAKATNIGLLENIHKGLNEELSYADCVQLFYNLMKTNPKTQENATKSSQTIYGSLLGFDYSSDDNELNLLSTLNANLSGPHTLKANHDLNGILPFSKSKGVFYLNGEVSSYDEIEDIADDDGAIAVYYNTSTKTVYAYSYSNNSGDMGSAHGTVDAIYYQSSSVMTPTSVYIGGEEYQIETSDMQYAFSVYGSVDQGDEVTIVWTLDNDNKKQVIALS